MYRKECNELIYRDKEDFLDEYDNLININNVGYVIQDFQNSLGRLNKLKDLYNPKMNENEINNNTRKFWMIINYYELIGMK